MEIILKEKIKKIGNIGDIVKVKKGYAKNFLIPNNKALYATPSNIELLNKQKQKLEEEYNNSLNQAKEVSLNLHNKAFIFIRGASESGALYGSVTSRNIADSLFKDNIKVTSHQILIKEPIKTIGTYDVLVEMHPDVIANIIVVVARSNEDADNMFKSHMAKLNKANKDQLNKDSSDSDKNVVENKNMAKNVSDTTIQS